METESDADVAGGQEIMLPYPNLTLDYNDIANDIDTKTPKYVAR